MTKIFFDKETAESSGLLNENGTITVRKKDGGTYEKKYYVGSTGKRCYVNVPRIESVEDYENTFSSFGLNARVFR